MREIEKSHCHNK